MTMVVLRASKMKEWKLAASADVRRIVSQIVRGLKKENTNLPKINAVGSSV